MILNNLEIKIILRWFEENTKNRFGDNIFFIGEENSIFNKINKLRDIKNETDVYFSYTELNILKNWSSSNLGLYEEKQLINKINTEINKSKEELLKYVKESKKKN